MILFYISVIFIPLIDSMFKYFIRQNLSEHMCINTFLPFLKITYVKNFGVALGMFAGNTLINVFISSIIMLYIMYLIFIKKNRDKLFLLSSSFVVGGGIGNLLDRIFLGFVTDYLQLTFFSPVCNISDYFISLGIVMMSVYILREQ